jgi:GNAT superfamily N-acetyltransferase
VFRDRYSGRDDLGAVYQLAVDPTVRRRNVGARLIQGVFARAAWGCRLFCCWCAQDLPANRFWQSVGFVPIAYRTGGRGNVQDEQGHKKPRMHIL